MVKFSFETIPRTQSKSRLQVTTSSKSLNHRIVHHSAKEKSVNTQYLPWWQKGIQVPTGTVRYQRQAVRFIYQQVPPVPYLTTPVVLVSTCGTYQFMLTVGTYGMPYIYSEVKWYRTQVPKDHGIPYWAQIWKFGICAGILLRSKN